MDERALVRQFRAYMHASERLMTTDAIVAKLDLVAHAVVHSGLFRRCVVRVYRRRFSSRRVLGAAGVGGEERRRLVEAEEAAPEVYLSLTEGARHLGGDCYHVGGALGRIGPAEPEAEARPAPGRGAGAGLEDWPTECFMAHLYSSRRVLLGHLVADDPPQGRIPDDESARSFVLFASLAAGLLEQELRLRIDPMTDAFNGVHLDRELLRLGEGRLPFSAVFADMDGLKAVNDGSGHQMGDHYIRAAHEILLASLPDDGLIYRPYGDEFVYLREGDEAEAVRAGVERAQARVRRWNESVRPDLGVATAAAAAPRSLPPLGLSIGMAHGRAADAKMIVRAAEAAMSAEKVRHQGGQVDVGPG